MFTNKLKFYELPPIRCYNCNKPIAHLFDDFNNLINTGMKNEEVFDIMGLKYCCRKAFFTQKCLLAQCNESKMMQQDIPIHHHDSLQIFNIDYKNNQCTPLHVKTHIKQKKLSDNLYVSYVSECVYITR
jgi:DNA-directed RNA polymerase subunit N